MTITNKLLDPKNDVAFKRIFGTERNKDILIHFINDMLVFKNNPVIVDVTFQPTIQDPDIASQKTSIIDVLCKDEQGKQYIVEMQVAKSKGFEKRAQYYAAKAYASQAKVGGLYENLQEVVFIAIADYVMFPDKQAIKSDHEILDRDTLTQDLKDFSFTFLELPKFTKQENELHHLEDTIEKWCYFFKYADEIDPKNLQDILSQHTIMEKAMNELLAFNWNDDELQQYESAEKRKNDYESGLLQKFDEGKAEGRVEGEAIGLEKGQVQIKLDLLKKKLARHQTDEQIMDAMEISATELQHLKSLLSKS